MGLEQLQNAYKRDLAALYNDSEDGVTRAAKRLKTSSMTTSFYPPSPLTNPDSPPANQEELLPPWAIESESESEEDVCIIDECIINTPPHYYSEDEDAIASSPEPAKVDDADFQFSPASPPLVQRKQDDDDADDDDDDDDDASLTTLYVFPDKTVVLTRDGEQVDIPDQHTITHTQSRSRSRSRRRRRRMPTKRTTTTTPPTTKKKTRTRRARCVSTKCNCTSHVLLLNCGGEPPLPRWKR